jgi:hypothetical protein
VTRPILEEMSQSAGWLLLTLQALCREQNGGVIHGPVTVHKSELERITKYWYPKLDHRLRELELLGLLVKDRRGRLILTESRRPWLRKSEPSKGITPGLGPTNSTNGVTPVLRSNTKSNVHSDVLNTVQSEHTVATDVRAVKNFTSVCPEVVSLVASSLRLLGINPPTGSAFVKGARSLAAKRLREGHTTEELLKVVKWAMVEWMHGNRFAALKQFNYLWGRHLPALIAAAKGGGVGGGGWGGPERVFTNVIKGETLGGERTGADRLVPPENEQSY